MTVKVNKAWGNDHSVSVKYKVVPCRNSIIYLSIGYKKVTNTVNALGWINDTSVLNK